MAGLDSTGFTTKRFIGVSSDLVSSEQQNIDASISTADDEFLGQLNSILANSISGLWELADSVNSNFDPSTSEGNNLDDLASLIGIGRFNADASEGVGTFIGVDGTSIPSGSIFSNPISGDTFKTQNLVPLLTTSCDSTKYSVKSLVDSTVYTITINGTDYDYTSDASATELEVLNGLEGLVTADVAATWSAVVDAGALQITFATEDTSTISVSSTTLISSDEVTVTAVLEATVNGALVVPINSVTNIVSPVTGLTSVTNLEAFSLGRDIETDEELRLRFSLSRSTNGLCTVDAIVAELLETTGVTSANVFENELTVTDAEGRPAKSFEALVEGGLDTDVGDTIWRSKAAGIQTYGNTAQNVTDNYGNSRTVNFTRPTDIHFAFRVTYSLYSEEAFPVNGEDAMALIMETTTTALPIDEDVIVTRYFGDIYSGVAGIDTLLVEYEILANAGDTPVGTWLTAKYPIAYNEKASTVATDVTFVEV